MKKILYFMMIFLMSGVSALLVSCSDKNSGAAEGTDRAFMNMFIRDEHRAKGENYRYN